MKKGRAGQNLAVKDLSTKMAWGGAKKKGASVRGGGDIVVRNKLKSFHKYPSSNFNLQQRGCAQPHGIAVHTHASSVRRALLFTPQALSQPLQQNKTVV